MRLSLLMLLEHSMGFSQLLGLRVGTSYRVLDAWVLLEVILEMEHEHLYNPMESYFNKTVTHRKLNFGIEVHYCVT